MALIECVLRDGITVIDKERMRYRFEDDGTGRFVCDINHPAHSAQFLGMGERAYRLVDEVTQEVDRSVQEVDESVSIEDQIYEVAIENPELKSGEIAAIVGQGVTHQKVTKILKN